MEPTIYGVCSNASGVLTNNGGGSLTHAGRSRHLHLKTRNALQTGATAYPDFAYIGTSETVLGAGGLGVTYGAILGSATINNLSNNLPVQTNGSNQLISAAINLSGSQVTGNLPAASIAAGSLGGGVIASSIAVNTVYPAAVSQAVYSNIQGLAAQTQALNMNTHQINNVSNPTNATDAANKQYVDSFANSSTNYIQNTNTLQAGATFYISSKRYCTERIWQGAGERIIWQLETEIAAAPLW